MNSYWMRVIKRQELFIRNGTGDKILINGTFGHRQLGYTDEWLYKAIAESGAKGEAANRDFFNIWSSGSQRSPLSVELNNKIRDSEMDPPHTTISKDLFMIRWYMDDYYFRRKSIC